MPPAIHLNLDDAWAPDPFSLPTHDARAWGPRIRYFLPRRHLPAFTREIIAPLPPFVLYGSGDFHHLTSLLLARLTHPVTVVMFDNHPDWDLRPPRHACGGWVNRALELPHVEQISIWGCGNFELQYPSLLFANRRDRHTGRLTVHPWADRLKPTTRSHFPTLTPETWQAKFEAFARTLAGRRVYVTVDLDCLDRSAAITNWENGLFTPTDVAWAITHLRDHCDLIAGDLCGAFSPVRAGGRLQRLASWWDHPPQPVVSLDEARRVNRAAASQIWQALTAADQPHPACDQHHPQPRPR